MIQTNVTVLNEISAKLGGKSDATLVVEALNNIANAMGDNEPDRIKTVSEALEDILEYAGGGGGSTELHPKLTLNVTPHNTGAVVLNGPICIPDYVAVLEDGCLVVLNGDMSDYLNTIAEDNTGTGTVVLYVEKEDETYLTGTTVSYLVHSTDAGIAIESVTASNPVNCSFDEGDITITDYTKDASIDLDVVFDGGVG